ncbi:polyadenylate-binding protein 7-like [Cynara cardunculus var. scolymus]|uniref:polyadenylate-binding protein 7-like n=1 Tax=Cynara cardunculus var. scolymus TaxID=59895 RepID=UPI000D6301A7|nr:polyadenylate-binding protein 7-like [Cynara cardunculus var. scolymus]
MAAPLPPPTPTTVTPPPASLYVGDLHPQIDDLQLSNAFSEYKSLSSVRVCRDSSTARSLCYGYVNFLSSQDAIHAIESKNNTMLYGKMIRVTWSHRDPDVRRSGIGNVFVKNLNELIDNVQLQELFKSFGNILSCKVVTLEDGKSKGYGFVQFDSEECANAAIEKLNGTNVGGKQIYVGKFMKKSDRVLPSPDAKYTNLYIKNLDLDMTEDILEKSFAKFGKIVSLVIARDDSGVSRGFGFVNFENPEDARKAAEDMNGLNLGSMALYVARAQKKAEREQILRRQFEDIRKEQILKYQGSNVYVKNIDDDVTEDELQEHFSQCGTITSAKLMCDDKGVSKGFGFVCFSAPDEAIKAVNTFHGYMFHRKPLYVSIAQRKEERKAQLQIQYAQRMVGLVGPSTVIPGDYPPLYYTTPSGIISQVPARPGVMYQPMGIRPGWRANGFAPPTRPVFQPSPIPFIPNGPRPHRKNRGRMNGQMQQPPYMPHLQQPSQTSKDSFSNPQWAGQAKHAPNGRGRDINKGIGSSSGASNSGGSVGEGSEMLSSMLAAASQEIQKQILGECLYPLVNQHKPDLAAKITGMLLEMDNSELLLLLESPESLAAKVEEAVQVLKLSKTKVSTTQDSLHPNILSAGVAVN